MQTPSVMPVFRSEGTVTPIRKIRVLVVDDSLVIRGFIRRALAAEDAFEVVGFAANGALALLQETQLRPDVITMDIEMPQMDGLATVSALRARGSKAVIIMCSTLTTHGGQSTIEALLRGADDYVTKPSGEASLESALETMRLELIPKIKQFFGPDHTFQQATSPRTGPRTGPRTARPPHIAQIATRAMEPRKDSIAVSTISGTPPRGGTVSGPANCEIVAIGVSTGGPTALLKLLPRLPAKFPLPIVIVQHMPPIFTRQLADRLNTESAIQVLEAEEGMALAPGRALLAPGDHHMRLKRVLHEVRVTLDDGERENSCRPAVDVLFRSVRAVYGSRALAVILTGMGQDGLRGVEGIKKEGGYVLAQDRASSVVWGMPGAVIEAGLADAVASLEEMVPAILRRVPRV